MFSLSIAPNDVEKLFPGLPETERGRPFCLKSDTTGKKLIYGVANSVIIRDIEDQNSAEIITCHAKKVTSACYAPSGYYVCSGDSSGSIKIWDTVNVEHPIKYEFQPFGGTIYDIAWCPESKRLILCGDGREKYIVAVSWDTGTNLGKLIGHTKACLSTDYRYTRPYAVISAGEDMSLLQYLGPPFKHAKTVTLHQNFVNQVRYNKDGSLAASAGQDGKIFIYDGATLDMKLELIEPGQNRAHQGGVYSISWSPCGKKILSASGDKTCKIWIVDENRIETVFEMGKDIEDQQLSCLWLKDYLVSLSLSGQINILDVENPTTPKKIIRGHNKGIVAAILSEDKKYILSGSYDGNINRWDVDTGMCSKFTNCKLNGSIVSISNNEDLMVATAVGKTIQWGSISSYSFYDDVASLSSEPVFVKLINQSITVVSCQKSLELIIDRKVVDVLENKFETASINCIGSDLHFAVCCSDGKVRFYDIEDKKLKIRDIEITVGVPLSTIHLSHDGSRLMVSAQAKEVFIYDVKTLEKIESWLAHPNRVNSVQFSPDSQHVVTCGIDGAVNIYKPGDIIYRVELRMAHRSYNVVAVYWLNSDTIVSIGQQDMAIKFWQLKL